MFAAVSKSLRQACPIASRAMMVQATRSFSVLTNNRSLSSKKHETDEEFDQRYIQYFSRPEIDGWEIRKGMTDLHGYDLVPEPTIVAEALRACRRVNDLGLAIRILEAVWDKCSIHQDTIWPYMVQELKPTCDELGVPFPEECGYDKPELWTKLHADEEDVAEARKKIAARNQRELEARKHGSLNA